MQSKQLNHKVLNPQLYNRLCNVFGDVVIHSEGSSFVAKKCKRAFDKLGVYPFYLNIIDSGEYYAVNCPVCGDSRHRLWVNHMWGQKFEGMSLNHLKCCYNENCHEMDDFNEVFNDLMNPETLSAVVIPGNNAEIRVEDTYIREIPGDTAPLDSLPFDHKLRDYMYDRGFDLKTLDGWGLRWITKSEHDKIHDTNRLIIPINSVINGQEQMVAWQTRYFDYHKGNPNPPSKYIPKYLIQGPTRLFVYNLHNTKKDFVVICEGVFDAIRVGKDHGVCTFGKHLTKKQAELIEDRIISKGGFAVFAFDPDVDSKQWAKLQKKIEHWPNTRYLHFPPGVDIADYHQGQVDQLVKRITENTCAPLT